MGQPACLKKMPSVQGRSCHVWRSGASKAPIGSLSQKSDDRNYKDSLESNESRSVEAFTELRQTPKALGIDVTQFI